jgi:hypothetical protein
MSYHALCFVDMPFGQKPDLKSGVIVDLDRIYRDQDQELFAYLSITYASSARRPTGAAATRSLYLVFAQG